MEIQIPVGRWMEGIVDWALRDLTGLFDAVSFVVGGVVGGLETVLLAVPVWAMLTGIVAVAAWLVSWRFGLVALLALGLVLGMDLWTEMMTTLALIMAATLISLVVGLPTGILAAKSDTAEAVIRPILDLMQTLPPFVYLIPAAMFFGLGKVPGAIATVIFAVPPAVRLTNLGIRNVDKELVEAGLAFGCTPRQLLVKVQLPAALPSIMAGVNQTIMLALSMVVIAAMIGAGGLGLVFEFSARAEGFPVGEDLVLGGGGRGVEEEKVAGHRPDEDAVVAGDDTGVIVEHVVLDDPEGFE